jgi:hypothetical protein
MVKKQNKTKSRCGKHGTKHQVLGKKMLGETLQAPTMESLHKLHYFPVQDPCLVPNKEPVLGSCKGEGVVLWCPHFL